MSQHDNPSIDAYEAPSIVSLGTIENLTRANLFGPESDNLTWILPILGDYPSS